MTEFDAEKFINSGCPCGCARAGRKAIVEGIEAFKETNKSLSDQLRYYRDHLVRKDEEEMEYRNLRQELGDDSLNKRTAEALRAIADKLEEPGPHFMIHCTLPNMPLFTGKDDVEAYYSSIKVTMVRCPLGG